MIINSKKIIRQIEGQGTGLGVSLSYDIITKEHSGTIKAETKEGEFAEFIIQLPGK